MSKRVLVTGGAGFLGSALVRRLVADGHQVRVLDNLSRGSERRKVEGARYLPGDVRDVHDGLVPVDTWDCKVATEDIDTVFHLAAINGTRHFYERPEEVLDVQIRGTLNVLDACKANGVKELVLFSSSEVYGQADQIPTPETVPLKIADPFNPRFSYAAGKIAAEMMCLHAKHLDRVLVIRPHNVYGPDMGEEHVIPATIRQLQTGERVVLQGTGNEVRAFTHVDDFIDGTAIAWSRCGSREIVHVGRPTATQITGLFLLLADLVCPDRRPDMVFDGGAQPGGPSRRCPDVEKLRSWGWNSKVSLEDGLARTVAWYQEWPKP